MSTSRPPAAPSRSRPRGGRRLWRALTSQRTGLVAGLTAAGLLAVGSLLMDRFPGPYAGLSDDDVRWFFAQPRLAFWWFYALAVALAVWGLSATACTIDSVAKRVRARIFRPSAYGAAFLHMAFVLALAGHLWGGLAASRQQVVLGPTPTTIGDATYEAADVESAAYPNGMPRRVDVTLIRRPTSPEGAPPERVHLGYNEPYVRDGGAFELLLNRAARTPVAVFELAGEGGAVRRGETLRRGGWSLTLHNVVAGRRPGAAPYADVTIFDPAGTRTRSMLGMGERPAGGAPAFRGLEERVLVAASVRRNPSVPLVVLAALLAAVGVLLVIAERRWRWRRAR